LNIGIHAEFANSTGDQMSVLTAGIEDGDLRSAVSG